MQISRRQCLHNAAATAAMFIAPVWAVEAHALRIGYQKGAGLLGLLKANATLERTLPSRGWEVSWSEFPAGPQLLEALNARSIDFGHTGAPPPIFAQAAGVDLVYVGAEPASVSTEAIIVKQQAPLMSIADIKDRSIAVQKGSSAHYLLLASLEKAGVRLSDVQVAYLAPADARAAFASDRVDSWAIWDPHLAGVQASTAVRVLGDYSNLQPVSSFYVATRQFAEQHREALSLVLNEIARAGTWAAANPHAAAELLAPQVGLPVAVTEVWQRRARYGVRPIDSTVLASQQRVADMFFAHAVIPKRVEIARAIWQWKQE